MSEAEPCPTCKGRCCRDIDLGYRTVHMGAECYEHVCELCVDGDKYVPSRNVHEERADVVAWLRASVSPGFADDLYDGVRGRADEIENGEHIGAAKRGTP